jgi:hypothetical protein
MTGNARYQPFFPPAGATSFMTFKMEAIVRNADRFRGPLASST